MFGFEPFVGLRYLMAKRQKNVFSMITFLSIAGVAVGVMALIVVLSVMGGFEDDLRGKILGIKSHIVVTSHKGHLLQSSTLLDAIQSVPGVIAASPYVEGEVMINSPSNLQGITLRGVDPKALKQSSEITQKLIEGSFEFLDAPEQLVVPPKEIPLDPDFLEAHAKSTMVFVGTEHGTSVNNALVQGENEMQGIWQTIGPPQHERLLGDRPEPSPSSLTLNATNSSKPSQKARKSARRRMTAIPMGPEKAQRPPMPALILGEELKKSLVVQLGSEVNIMSPLADISPMGKFPKSRPFQIAGTFYTGMYEYDTQLVFIALSEAQRFFNMEGEITGIEIRIRDPENSEEVKAALQSKLSSKWKDLEIKDWKEMNASLFGALLLEKVAMFVILTFIILVASFSIICLLIMIVIEKAREIAILKSMGASDQSIRWIFVIQGGVIGLLGTLLGFIAGLTLCKIIASWGIPLPADVYYLSYLPVQVNPIEVLWITAASIVISLLATLYPAHQAAKLKPVDGLRLD